jgi:hypothetical protein
MERKSTNFRYAGYNFDLIRRINRDLDFVLRFS